MNEFIFILICYHLVLFGNLIDDFETLTLVGTSLAVSCATMLGINLLIIMVVNVGQAKQYCRKKTLEKKRKQEIEKQRNIRQKKADMQIELQLQAK